MADNNEKNTNQEPEIIIEKDKEIDSLLDDFETPSISADDLTGDTAHVKKKNGHIKTLLISLAGAAVLIGIVCLLIFLPSGDDSSSTTVDEASLKTSVDDDNVWQAQVKTDDDGEIKKNGSGTLLEYVPADIKKMHIVNEKGSFTVTSYTPTTTTDETDPDTGEEVTTTDTTEYTLVGYEDFELQSGYPDEIASACAELTFDTVIQEDASDNLSDYGLDDPRSKATVTYTDKKKAVIYVGDDAPQGVGTYIMFGSSDTVYLCDTESVEALLYGVTDLISLTINDSASDSDSADFKYLNLTGSAYGEKITIKYSDETDSIYNSYVLTSPSKAYADNDEASNVSGAVRGLYASAVVCVNPTQKQLKKYGLSGEYAHVYAKYPDTTVNLYASKPDSDGNCYLMKNNGKIIYQIASSSIPWVTTSYDSLVSDYVLYPQLTGLSAMEVTCDSKTYKFKVKTTVETSTDDSGSTTSTTTTTVKYNGKEMTESYFETFFRNVSLITLANTDSKSISGSPACTVKYTYSSKSKSADTIKFYKTGGNTYTVTLNSKVIGQVYSTYVNKLIEQAPKIAKDKEVKSFW